jgi:hypothetical protein
MRWSVFAGKHFHPRLAFEGEAGNLEALERGFTQVSSVLAQTFDRLEASDNDEHSSLLLKSVDYRNTSFRAKKHLALDLQTRQEQKQQQKIIKIDRKKLVGGGLYSANRHGS